jgi:peptide-methionine (R)-S-oxide reductase
MGGGITAIEKSRTANLARFSNVQFFVRASSIFLVVAVIALAGVTGIGMCGQATASGQKVLDALPKSSPNRPDKVVLSDAAWRKRLTPEQYNILRQEGTERAFSGRYAESKEKGTYVCGGCGLPLFTSDTKFDSGTGWPSFFKPIGNNVWLRRDTSLGEVRTEVLCSRCNGHLGHVFDDAPQTPTGLRFCMNSDALVLKKP